MSISTIMTQIQSLSAADKLLLNQQLASCMVGQTTSVAAKSSRKGKPAAAGTLAWTAFVAHVVKSMPERFAPPALPKERLSIAGAIRLENPEAYKTFCEKWIADMPARDSDAESVTSPQESVASTPSDKPKRVISDEQKAKMKAGREKKAAEKKALKAAEEQAATTEVPATPATITPVIVAEAPAKKKGKQVVVATPVTPVTPVVAAVAAPVPFVAETTVAETTVAEEENEFIPFKHSATNYLRLGIKREDGNHLWASGDLWASKKGQKGAYIGCLQADGTIDKTAEEPMME